MHGPDQAPRITTYRRTELGGPLPHDLPVLAEDVEALHDGGAERQQAAAEPPCGARAGGRDGRGDGDLEVGLGERTELEAGVAQREPPGLAVDGLLVGEQRHDRLERLFHHVPLLEWVDAHHPRVRRQ